jgi:hypothetical protein
MKKIIIAFIANFIFTICLGQIVKQGCNIFYDYSSSAGWTIDKHLYNLNCQTNTPPWFVAHETQKGANKKVKTGNRKLYNRVGNF